MTLTRSLKPAATIAQQIDRLRSRGMEVDEDLAQRWFENVSYYRLSAYWYPARQFTPQGKRSDDFVAGTSFNDVVALYEADRKLRTLVHDGMERVEIAMRTHIGELLCASDPLAYTHPDRFRPTFNHARWIATAHKRIKRVGSSHEAIKHYRDEYDGQYPFWVLAEVLDFADISRIYGGLLAQDQRQIAEELGFVVDIEALSKNQQWKVKRQPSLVRWMEQLTIIRNICAHHGRLWNKSFVPVPTFALRTQEEFASLPENQSEQTFGALLVMSHLLKVTSPGTTWPAKVMRLLEEAFLPNPLVSPSALGLPKNWNSSRF